MPKLDLSDIGIDFKAISKRIEEELKTLSEEKQKEIIRKSGLSNQQISNYFGKGKKLKPSLEVIVKMAHVLGKPVDYYLYGKYQSIEDDPVCMKIPCILPILNKEQDIVISAEKCFFMNKKYLTSKKLYCMEITGSMMHPTLLEKDVIIIDYSYRKIITEGKIHVFFSPYMPYIQIKRLCIMKDKIMVKPDNRDYPPYMVDHDKIRIIGQVISIFKLLV